MFIVCGLNPTITPPPPPTNPPGRGLAYYLTPAWLILIKNHVVIKCFKYSPFYHVSFQPYNACFNFRFTYPWEETELWNIERVRVLTEIVSAVYIVALLLRSMTTLIQFDNGLRQAFRCSRGSTQKPCRVRERERQEHTSCRTIKICIEDHFKPDWRYVRTSRRYINAGYVMNFYCTDCLEASGEEARAGFWQPDSNQRTYAHTN